MGMARSKAEEVGCFGQGDILELGWVIQYGTNPQRESRFLVQEEGKADNAQRRGDRSKVGVVDVAKDRNFLTVLFVLLCPPANVDAGDVGQLHVGDVVDGDFSIEEELKVLRNECFWRLKGPGCDAFVVGFGGLTSL